MLSSSTAFSPPYIHYHCVLFLAKCIPRPDKMSSIVNSPYAKQAGVPKDSSVYLLPLGIDLQGLPTEFSGHVEYTKLNKSLWLQKLAALGKQCTGQ